MLGPGVPGRFATRNAAPNIIAAAKYVDAEGNPIKAAVSAYMHFCAERRTSLTAELKASLGAEYKNTIVMKKLGEEWRQQDTATVARFEAIAAEDKARYAAAVASNPANKTVKKGTRKSSGGPKPLSAYMHFCAERRPGITAALKASKGSEFKASEVMVQLGEEWRNLDDASKEKFQAVADKQRAELAAAAA